MTRESGGTGNPNHAKSHTCCTFIAPQAVQHLQLLRHKILSRLALQAKYRQFTQPHRHYTNSILSPTGILEICILSPTGIVQRVYSAPQALQTVYSALQALCKQYILPHRHYANSIFRPTGIKQYTVPYRQNSISPHRCYT